MQWVLRREKKKKKQKKIFLFFFPMRERALSKTDTNAQYIYKTDTQTDTDADNFLKKPDRQKSHKQNEIKMIVIQFVYPPYIYICHRNQVIQFPFKCTLACGCA